MTTYRVEPAESGWLVKTGSGYTKSNHRKKSAARRAARGYADSGDRIIIRRNNGTIQDKREVRS